MAQSPWQLGVEFGYQNPVKTDYTSNQLVDGYFSNEINIYRATNQFKQEFKLQTMDLQAKAFYQLPQMQKMSLVAGVGFEYAKLTNQIKSSYYDQDKFVGSGSGSEAGRAYTGELFTQFAQAVANGIKYDQNHTAFLPEVSLGGTYHVNEHVFFGINWRQVFGSKPAVYDKLADAYASGIDQNLSRQPWPNIADREKIPQSNIDSITNIVKKSVAEADNKKVPGGYTVMFNVGYQF